MLKMSLDDIETRIETLKVKLVKAKMEISGYSGNSDVPKEKKPFYERALEEYYLLKDGIKQLEEERRAIAGYLRTHGEGEISALKKIYPNTFLEIKKLAREISKTTLNTTLFYQDRELKEL